VQKTRTKKSHASVPLSWSVNEGTELLLLPYSLKQSKSDSDWSDYGDTMRLLMKEQQTFIISLFR
jgi:hypothetical protein